MTRASCPSATPGGSIAGIARSSDGIPIGFRGLRLSLPARPTAERTARARSFDLFYLGSAICPTLRRPAITAMLCLGGHLGVLRSHPETQGRDISDKTEPDLERRQPRSRMHYPARRSGRAHRGVPPVLPILRPTSGYTRSDAGLARRPACHKVSAFAMAADAGIGLLFPVIGDRRS